MSSRDKTLVPPATDVVLVIGGSDDLRLAVSLAATTVHGSIDVHRCDFLSAVSEAAKIRPMAIAMSSAVYAFDPAELSVLARDVGASLLIVDSDGLGVKEAARVIRPQLQNIFASRHHDP